MGILDLFKRSKSDTITDETNLNRWLNINAEEVTAQDLMSIPTVSGCVNVLSSMVASLPVQLFKEDGKKVSQIQDDPRLVLLNDVTGDTLNSFELKQALITDYLCFGSGYAYINRRLNDVKSIHYVENARVSILSNHEPIFKHSEFNVNGVTYQNYDFIRLLRRSRNGATGIGVLNENFEVLKMVYNCLRYENNLVSSGGNKKGFIKAQEKLSKEAIESLKAQWKAMYSNNTENCIVLNNGLEFQESSNTSVEMQLKENKSINALEICKMFGVPEHILNGGCTDEQFQGFIKTCLSPIITAFESALNAALLTNDERLHKYYFKLDTKELLKADILKRMNAYSIAVRNGIMQIDEVRYIEDLEPLELGFIKLGLQDVLYNPKTKEIYTPNTNKTNNVDDLKGSESQNENRDKE